MRLSLSWTSSTFLTFIWSRLRLPDSKKARKNSSGSFTDTPRLSQILFGVFFLALPPLPFYFSFHFILYTWTFVNLSRRFYNSDIRYFLVVYKSLYLCSIRSPASKILGSALAAPCCCYYHPVITLHLNSAAEADQQEIGADSAFVLISAGTIGRQRRHAAVES